MCGISGLFSSIEFSKQQIKDMSDLIRHRGPDDEGFVFFESNGNKIICGGTDTPQEVYGAEFSYSPHIDVDDVENQNGFFAALGHRRLSIVDVSPAGHQPMTIQDERFWIVYNGEIYNHIELRRELEACGIVFRSHSDTEVILAAYKEWGRSCLSKFNGMFSFVIYDSEKSTLFIARDRFGVKPLYYWIFPGGVAFASEIKQFSALPRWQAVMNEPRVYDFLNWGITDHTDETLFDGVFQLRGGQALEIGVAEMLSASSKLEAGYKLPVYNWYVLREELFEGTFEQAAKGFEERLRDAVKLRLRADVAVGSCLSGGLDSSSIVVLMNRLMREENAESMQKTFSACSTTPRFDEREFIHEIVDCTDVDAHYTFPDLEELFQVNEKLTWHQDEPFGSTSIFAQWKVFQLAAESGVKVMLDGQGADEQLAGYHTFFAPHFASLFKQGRWLELWREIRMVKKRHGYSELTAVKYIADMLLPDGLRQWLRRLSGKASANPEWINMASLKTTPHDPFADLGGKSGSLKQFSKAQLTSTNLQMLLHWEDRDSMAHSVESRVPFLDYRLVEYVLGLPDSFKLNGGVTKLVLRESMRSILPERVRLRMDKLGFVTPEEVWLRELASDRFRQSVRSAVAASKGVLNTSAIDLLEKIISGEKSFNFVIWRIISFGTWVQQFNVIRK